MNTEDFDEAIRKKLESLNQPYSDAEIDKVYSHVQRKRKFPFKGSGGSWLLYSLSAAAFTVVTILTVSHFQDQRDLAFNSKNSTQKVNINTVDSTVSTGNASDTAEFKASETIALKLPEPESVTASESVQKNEISTKTKQTTSSKPENAKPASAIPVTSQPGKESVINLGRDKTSKPVILAETKANSTVKIEDVFAKPDSIDIKTQVNSQLPQESQPIAPEVIPILISENKKDDLAKVPDTLISEKSVEPVRLPDSAAKSKNVKIRIGADFQLSNQSFGTGISGEVLFNNHFGIETGLIYRTYQAVQFPDKDAFFMHQHHDFNHGIENHFQGKDHIRDVSINNRTLEIPITLKYYVPLKKNFSVYFSLGTNVDIYLNQKLNYTFNADSGKTDNGTYKSQGNVVPFNNLVISAGLEKQWKSLSFQIQPYIAPRLKDVFYKPKELEFGLGVGVKYSFGKRNK